MLFWRRKLNSILDKPIGEFLYRDDKPLGDSRVGTDVVFGDSMDSIHFGHRAVTLQLKVISNFLIKSHDNRPISGIINNDSPNWKS